MHDFFSVVGDMDYAGGDAVVTLDERTSQSCHTIGTFLDDILENNETFTVTLSSEDDAVMFSSPQSITVTILDDDLGKLYIYIHKPSSISSRITRSCRLSHQQ